MAGIVLIGFMGCGKTTAGRALSDKTGLEFADTDDMVVAAAGRSVGQIFHSDGEAGFRALETDALVKAVADGPRIIACGGGAVLVLGNVRLLRAAGPMVYLRTSADELRRRLGDGRGRPLLDDPDAFTRLLAERTRIYASIADAVIDTDGRTPSEVADAILEAVGQ